MGVILGIIGIVVALVLLFKLAIFAVPFFVGMQAFLWGMDTGAGPIGAALLGLVAAGVTLGIAQVLFSTIRVVWVRGALALAFGVPAAVAGYHVVIGMASLAVPSEAWRMVFAVIGGMVAGASAVMQLFALGAASRRQEGTGSRPSNPQSAGPTERDQTTPRLAGTSPVALLPPPADERPKRLS
jgi:hypothetical protein